MSFNAICLNGDLCIAMVLVPCLTSCSGSEMNSGSDGQCKQDI